MPKVGNKHLSYSAAGKAAAKKEAAKEGVKVEYSAPSKRGGRFKKRG